MIKKKKVWTEQEIKYLISDFPILGSKICAKHLNRKPKEVQCKAQKLGIIFIGNNLKYSYENIKDIVEKSKNFSEAVRLLGLQPNRGNRKTIQKYIGIYKFDVSHFIYYDHNYRTKNEIPLNKVLIENSSYLNTSSLKKKLYKFNLKKPTCELCGQDENWKGKKISLILDHINGNNHDNRIENLQIVCPNCAATLSTHCSKNIKNKKNILESIKKNSKKNKCNCGNTIDAKSNRCWNCHVKERNKREKPTLEQLKKDVESAGYSATGRKYNVSDNCIRKWIEKYLNASVG